MKSFKVPNSTYVNVVTYGVGLILLSIIWIMLQKSFFSGEKIGALKLLFSIVIALVGLYFFANSPKKLTVDRQHLTIEKNVGKVKIPRSAITKVSQLANKELKVFTGSSGFFGFLGKGMENSQSFVKDRGRMLKLETSQGNYLLSCEDRVGFMKALELN